MKIFLANQKIKAEKVRVIDEKGKNLGIFKLEEALDLAKKRGLDLIQVTEKLEIPVCKLGNYGRYLYEFRKKRKKIEKGGILKNIRISFNISDHDLRTKVGQAERFLKKKNKVRVELKLKGRENIFKEYGKEKIEKFLEKLKEKISFKIEREIKVEPRGITVIISKL